MKSFLITAFSALSFSAPLFAQSINFPDDQRQRGYYDRPYLRYEAEPEYCNGNFTELPKSFLQSDIQSEASNQTAILLVDKGDYVSWKCDKNADALSLRFSLPDSPDGTGTKGSLSFLVNDEKVTEINLDSYWAWQYNPVSNSQTKYPDNIPSENKFARMRFDEVYVKLPIIIKEGDNFSLMKEEDSNLPYTIDFIELEMAPEAVTFEKLEGDKVMYEGDGSTLQSFINYNAGKTIYLPAGEYRLNRRLFINDNDTKLIGAGMWYTSIIFTAAPDNRRTAGERGFESNASGVVLEGFSVNTISNMRYFENNESVGIGKGLQGSFGKNSVIRNLRIDHFECGGWIADYSGTHSEGLVVEYCRFRNNYADGINLCSGSLNAEVSHCSFRNNGDDDMASWSTGNWTKNNTFSYCTAENNWRASSLGFFGGENNQAHHIVVADALEGGVRVNADFQGTGFSREGKFTLSHISIYRSGCFAGRVGEKGDHWGNAQPSLLIQPGTWYDINNLLIEDIDIYNTRFQAITIKANGGKMMNNLKMNNISVHGINEEDWDFFMATNLVGNGTYSNLNFDTDPENAMSKIPSRFDFMEKGAGINSISEDLITILPMSGGVRIESRESNCNIIFYDMSGKIVRNFNLKPGVTEVPLPKGLYILKSNALTSRKKIMST